ncbi:MAG: isopeptide-forming domain-containing fimbrial protein [Planctomycetaceae bacterium]|nr:isopeptide-forming domain-containing fimbrial protein [Planctomycetaceae bacterium]
MSINHNSLTSRFTAVVAVIAICSLSACSSLSRQSATSSVVPPDSRIESTTSRKAAGTATVSSGPVVPPSVTPSFIQQTSAWQDQSGRPYDEPISRTSHSAISFSPAERRADVPVHLQGHPSSMSPHFEAVPGSPCQMCQINGTMCDACRGKSFPDEYISDGGDRGLPFHYEHNERAGFESEDTVAEFEDHTGESSIKVTNRVSIYSPRFAAVRTVSLPSEGTVAQYASGTDKTLKLHDINSQLGTTYHNEYESMGGVRMRARASGLESEADPDTLGQTTVAGRNDKLQNVFQNLLFLSTGRFEQSEAAVLAGHVDAAAHWTRHLSPTITAHTSAGNQVESTFKPMEIVGLEDSRKTKGDLQIVKLADRKIAAPGDVITFTLRYDNLGDFELKNLRIVDNLTPRLEYIEGSANFGDRAGEVQTYDNNEGSLILQFKLSEDLPGHTGGTITFQTRVRPFASVDE